MSKNNQKNQISRRDFIKTSTAAGAGVVLGVNTLASAQDSGKKTRYAIVGVGSRSRMYRAAILGDYAPYCQMVGFCDVNLGRLKLAQRDAKDKSGVEIEFSPSVLPQQRLFLWVLR